MKPEIDAALLQLLRSDDLAALKNQLIRPNIFELAGMGTQEIKHSRFLSVLLDPNSPLKIGHSFVKRFLRRFLSNIPDQLSEANNLSPFTIELNDLFQIDILCEYRNIDILIIDREKKFFVAIENKIKANESKSQLSKYRTRLQEEFPDYESLYLFLTPDGREGVTDDLWIVGSYIDVIKTIDEVLSNESINTTSRLLIEHYKSLLERRVVNQDELTKLANRIYRENKLAIDFINEHKSDSLGELSALIADKISEEINEVSQRHSVKSYLRYSSPSMDRATSLLPGNGWGDSSIIVWEISIKKNKLALAVVLGPSNDQAKRNFLRDSIQSRLGKSQKTDKWTSLKRWNLIHLSEDFDTEVAASKAVIKFKEILASNLNEVDEFIDSSLDEIGL